MRRRSILVLAALAAAVGSFGIPSGQASAEEVPPTVSTTVSQYWACVALDYVEIGACIGNPLPDPSGLPSVRQVIYDTTGIYI